ncbi:D-glycerate dehydrogenase [Candidatus Uhrbacteria bacterium CG_4_9_14_3_um_filter_36_7]|uniref:D-glycerate dehydrogenase n=1 Tax=Candidatus Uhrbacteria bacterium CG_4_9_14_3_um_filter_36_7 TaxID=1975033 RepID=A0A2M7XH75_9BACT|nr:MAG: D-glycerate dehydrogenase [Candidatus Uhrbacteria bacterium CG_4_9_14_3_um_filter_36_7]
MTTKLFITRSIGQEAIKKLKKQKGLKVEVYKEAKKIPRQLLLKKVKGVDIIVSLLTERIDKQVFQAAGDQLKLIANYAVGFNNIDLDEAKKRSILVTNTPCSEVSESVAEHAIALMFSLCHRLVEADQFTRKGKYAGWDPDLFLGTDIMGKTIGIIGAGRIGTNVIRRLYDGFGVKIIYHNQTRVPELEKTYKALYRSKEQLLKESDIISLHVPLLPSTFHLISKKEFKLMKKTAFLINTARGPIIDEKALLQALAKKQIAGAGLDVYECEPLIDCDPNDHLELRQFPNVILTPHTASATIEARTAMAKTVVQNILAFLQGKIPPNLVQ